MLKKMLSMVCSLIICTGITVSVRGQDETFPDETPPAPVQTLSETANEFITVLLANVDALEEFSASGDLIQHKAFVRYVRSTESLFIMSALRLDGDMVRGGVKLTILRTQHRDPTGFPHLYFYTYESDITYPDGSETEEDRGVIFPGSDRIEMLDEGENDFIRVLADNISDVRAFTETGIGDLVNVEAAVQHLSPTESEFKLSAVLVIGGDVVKGSVTLTIRREERHWKDPFTGEPRTDYTYQSDVSVRRGASDY